MIQDWTNIFVSNLPAAKRKLEIPSAFAPSAAVEVSIVATENLSAFGPVTSQGKKADSANPSASFGRVIGLATTAITSGFSGQVIEAGEITNPAWAWTIGDPIFLSGTGLSSTPPVTGFVQQIGTAKGLATMVVDLSDPVLL